MPAEAQEGSKSPGDENYWRRSNNSDEWPNVPVIRRGHQTLISRCQDDLSRTLGTTSAVWCGWALLQGAVQGVQTLKVMLPGPGLSWYPCVLLCRDAASSDQNQPEYHHTTAFWTVKTWLVGFQKENTNNQLFRTVLLQYWSLSPADWQSHQQRGSQSLTQTLGTGYFSDGHYYLLQGSETARDPSAKGSSCLKTFRKCFQSKEVILIIKKTRMARIMPFSDNVCVSERILPCLTKVFGV